MQAYFLVLEVLRDQAVQNPIEGYIISTADSRFLSMTFRHIRLLPVLALVLVTSALSAQQPGEGNSLTPEQIKAMRRNRAEKGMVKGDGREAASDANWEQMSPEEKLRSNVRRGAKTYCRFNVSCRPAQLLPGQSGVLMIVASLLGSAVLPTPLNLSVTSRVPSNSVVMGDFSARPAPIGTMSEAYLGQPVYENTLVLEVPVTMGSTLALGDKQSVAADLQFDIYDGESGRPVGRFIERVSMDILIAAHLDPVVAGSDRAAEIATDIASEPLPSGGNQKVSEPKEDDVAMSGTAARVVEEVVEVETVGDSLSDDSLSDELLPIADSGAGGYMSSLAAGFGIFFCVIVFLMMRKKR